MVLSGADPAAHVRDPLRPLRPAGRLPAGGAQHPLGRHQHQDQPCARPAAGGRGSVGTRVRSPTTTGSSSSGRRSTSSTSSRRGAGRHPARAAPTSRCASPPCTTRRWRPRASTSRRSTSSSQPYTLAEDDWDSIKESVADRVLAELDGYFPGLSSSVLHRQVLSPLDLERMLGLTGGHALHGEMAPGPAVHEPARARPRRLPDPDRRPLPLRGRNPPGRRSQRRERTQLRHRGLARPPPRAGAGLARLTGTTAQTRRKMTMSDLWPHVSTVPSGPEEQGVLRSDGRGRGRADAGPRRGARSSRRDKAGLADRRRRRQRLRRPGLGLGCDTVRRDAGARPGGGRWPRNASTAWRSPTTSRTTWPSSSPRSWWRSRRPASPA